MPAKKEIRDIGGLRFESTPLAPFDTLELQADVGDLIARAVAGRDGPASAVMALKGKFRTVLPRLFEGTTVFGLDAHPKGLSLGKEAAITEAFYGRLELLPEAIKLVAEVSFLPFIGALGRLIPDDDPEPAPPVSARE